MTSTPLLDRRALRAALFGGLVGGACDITYAFVAYGMVGISPVRIMHIIASGWLGKAAFEGGAATAALGLASHFMITCIAATIYVAASRRIDLLVSRPVISGAAFGLGIWIVMNYVVVPLSAAASGTPRGRFYVMGLIVHVFFIGVPIALFARRAALPAAASQVPLRSSPYSS
jgi:hypothetical protein